MKRVEAQILVWRPRWKKESEFQSLVVTVNVVEQTLNMQRK